jgi:hypothetical protein
VKALPIAPLAEVGLVITGGAFTVVEEIVTVRLALAVPPLAGPRAIAAAPGLGVPDVTLLELIAVTVTTDVPGVVGIPEISPVALLIDRPSGKPAAL